jgi:hypothetical protein
MLVGMGASFFDMPISISISSELAFVLYGSRVQNGIPGNLSDSTMQQATQGSRQKSRLLPAATKPLSEKGPQAPFSN